MTTMKALRLTAWQSQATFVPRPVAGCGRCADVTTFPLEEALAAYAGLAAGEIVGRAVIVPFAHYAPDR